MSWKAYLVAAGAGLLAALLIASLQSSPGYMDAEYYYAMGLQIASNGSLEEPFIWNYHSPAEAAVHPGFSYWMPLPALLAAGGVLLSGWPSFAGARLGALLMAAAVPAVTMLVAYRLSGRESVAWLAAGFSIFPAFYASYLPTTDSFGLLMVLGALFFLAAESETRPIMALFLGVLAGLIHLSRAEGLIWLAGALVFAASSRSSRLGKLLLVGGGYLLLMGPWLARNWMVFGQVLPAGSSRMLWLSEYNDLFSFQPEKLSFAAWSRQGMRPIIRNVLEAGWMNLKTAFLIQGQLILAPLIGWGFFKYRSSRAVLLLAGLWGVIFLLMSAAFPFAGARGGFFHAGAAFQPLFWSLAGVGLMAVLDQGVRRLDWKISRASIGFGLGLIIIMAFSTVFLVRGRVIGEDQTRPAWEQSAAGSLEVHRSLLDLGVNQDDLVMINNPPGLFSVSGRSSIVIPNGDLGDLLAAAERYGAGYLILEPNHPQALQNLYQNPADEEQLILLESREGIHYFLIPGVAR